MSYSVVFIPTTVRILYSAVLGARSSDPSRNDLSLIDLNGGGNPKSMDISDFGIISTMCVGAAPIVPVHVLVP